MESKDKGFFVISVQMHPETIKETLMSMGISSDDIVTLKEYDDINAKNMYFEDEIIKLKDASKMFADIGSYDGNDMLRYLKWCKYAEGGYSFESDIENFKVCKEL